MPDRDWLSGLGPPLDGEIVNVVVAVLKRDTDRASGGSRSRSCVDAEAPLQAGFCGKFDQQLISFVPPTAATFQPGLTPALAAALSRSTAVTSTEPSTSRTSMPMSPDRSRCAGDASELPGIGEVRLTQPFEHVAQDATQLARSSPSRRADATRCGRRSSRRRSWCDRSGCRG